MNEFKNMPKISKKAKEYMATGFTPYLFFKILKRGVRQYTCTECGETFEVGESVLKRTLTPVEIALWHAEHNSKAVCPLCGKKATVKNIKLKSPMDFGEAHFVCFLLSNSYDDVWIRCYEFGKNYNDNAESELYIREEMRYHLKPGSAEFWDGGIEYWYKKDKPGEAFLWNHGWWNEKYDYCCYADGTDINDTFLKYNSYNLYEAYCNYKSPYIKYLCWYAIHPQIEILVKLGHYKTVDEMIFNNNDIKSILDWNAKTPWGLHRLTRQIYNCWKTKYFGDMKILRLYRALRGSKIEDLKTAQTVYEFSHNRFNAAKQLISMTKKLKVTVKQVIKYCEKVSRESAGCCHCCPGITTVEAYQMWRDYLSMAERAGVIKTVSVFPSDLKSAHDSFLTAEQLLKAESDAKKLKKAVKNQAAAVAKRFPKLEEIYKQIKDKYSYTDGKYAIIVPTKIEDLVLNNVTLHLCMDRTDRYYERISTRESYIMFLRFADKPNVPWYTLEVEPSGTLRQKRTTGDAQLSDLDDAMPFLHKWQEEVSRRLNKSDRRLANKSKILRNEQFEELRRTGKTINYGDLCGRLLVDVLERDLMEAEETA